MPIQFSGIQVENTMLLEIVLEYLMFLIWELLIEGDDLVPLLQSLVPSDIKLTPGKQYTTFLNLLVE